MSDTESLTYSRMQLARYLLAISCSLLWGCSGSSEANSMEEFSTRPIVLPDGTTIRVESMMRDKDMMRGMMFRDALPEGRGMLFFHGSTGKYPYWMYQVKIPLDIIWMDKDHRVVEISPNTPPCTTPASQCVNYGGTQDALIVLELPAGSAARHGIKTGAVLQF